MKSVMCHFLGILCVVFELIFSTCVGKFPILTAAKMMMTVSWTVEPSSTVEIYQRFRGLYCLNH